MIIDQHRAWLNARGITNATIDKFAIHTHDAGKSGSWVRVPFMEGGKVVTHKWRKTMAKDHRMDPGQPLILFNQPALARVAASGDQTLIITEGEWDALIFDQCGWEEVVSVPNGAPDRPTEDIWEADRYQWFRHHRDLLDRVKQFILATDNDKAGRLLASELAQLLGPERCLFLTYPEGCKDANDVWLKHGAQGITHLLGSARPYPIRGLYRLADFPDPPEFKAMSIGIPGLEDLWPLVPGTFSVVTGWPGHGKSSAVLVAVANLIQHGVGVAIGSFETLPKPILERKLRASMYRCWEHDPKVRRRGHADDLLDKYLSVISNLHVDEETELDIEGIIELAKVAVLRDGVRLLVLDPWNEIEHKRASGESETEYVGRAIRLLKRYGRDYRCAVWVVAHPRKPATDGSLKRPSLMDLAGSANFANKADYGVIFYRADLATMQAEATVSKVRMGLPGKMGRKLLGWNENTSAYDLDEIGAELQTATHRPPQTPPKRLDWMDGER